MKLKLIVDNTVPLKPEETRELDSIIQKYDLDSRFYRNSLAGDTTVCKTSLITRLEMAVAEMDQARLELQSIILH